MNESLKLHGYEIMQAVRGLWIIVVDGALVPLAYIELKQLEGCANKKLFEETLSRIWNHGDLRRALAESAKMQPANELDHARIKKQIANSDGVLNTVDDLLTNPDAAMPAMDDPHEELP